MIKNNILADIKLKCIEEGMTQTQIAEKLGTSAQYVSKTIKKGDAVVNKTFVGILDVLGYDIELHYIKQDNSKHK